MEICGFKIAKKLKEKGYQQEPKSGVPNQYYEWDGLRNIHPLYVEAVWYESENKEYLYYAPTISQVLKWLREEKQIEVVVLGQDYIGGPYFADIFTKDGLMNKAEPYPKWELAAIAGVEYTLDNLI